MTSTKLVLLTTQRSGSTYFRLWLDSHPNVRCHSEVFLNIYNAADGFKAYCEANRMRQWLSQALMARRSTSRSRYNVVSKWLIDRYLDALFHDPSFSAPWTDMDEDVWAKYQPRDSSANELIVGFQLMYDQLEDYQSALQRWIAGNNATIVHLYRENCLKVLVSNLISRTTGEFHFAHQQADTSKVALDPVTTLKQLDKMVAKRNMMRQLFAGNPFVEVTYEDFFGNYAEASKKLLKFLSLQDTELSHPKYLKKLHSDNLGDLIENYDEISQTLHGSPHAVFL